MKARRIFEVLTYYTFLFVVISLSDSLAQSSYYISSSGNDSSDGKSAQTPWKTIAKINSVSIVPGDAILFHRGDEFFGQITLMHSGTMGFSAYGPSSEKPVITGAVHLHNWVLYSGSTYVTTSPYPVKSLYMNGVQVTLARYPNAGFLSIGTTNGTTTFSADGLNQLAGYWNGANVRIRTSNFTFETRQVVSYDGSHVTLSSPLQYPLKVGWGFYLDNKFQELDSPGEWYSDPNTNLVYFSPPNGVNPNLCAVDGSVFDYGITSTVDQNNLTVQGLGFYCQSQAAIRLSGTTSNIRLLSNHIFDGFVNGIEIDGITTSCTIDGNTIEEVNGRGIYLEKALQSTISNNTLKNIGLVQGYGVSATNGMTGIVLLGGTQNLISNNIIDSTGYIGIRTDGSFNIVTNNIISNVMLKLADGGAIYGYNDSPSTTFGGTWQNNIITNVVGNTEGVPLPSSKDAVGIYVDNGCYDMLVANNTVVRTNDIGVFINTDSYRITVRNNVLYDCGDAFLQIKQDATMNHGGNVIKGNIFFPGNANQKMVLVQQMNVFAGLYCPGTLDSNYYCNPFNSSTPFWTLTFSNTWANTSYSFTQWKVLTGQDVHSKDLWEKSPISMTADSLFVNRSSSPLVAYLGSSAYRDLDSNLVTVRITVNPYSSRILLRDSAASGKTTSLESHSNATPAHFDLFQNYPNPFNPSTIIRYALPLETRVRLEIFDSTGRRITVLVDELEKPGYHEVRFDGSALASGVYFYRLLTDVYSVTKKLLLIR